MPYIYKITNLLNGKLYIGKTLGSIEGRWKEHCTDSQRERCEKRPLYSAMNKYGIENFKIEEVEFCCEEVVNEREKYWIQYYGSFINGYNATIGGDGKARANYDLFLSLFKEGNNIKQISKITGFGVDTVSLGLSLRQITSEEKTTQGRVACRNGVAKLDLKTGEIIEVFPSITEGCRSVGKKQSGHIASVCKGKRKSAYGYGWKYI